jgi:hypothetical protein
VIVCRRHPWRKAHSTLEGGCGKLAKKVVHRRALLAIVQWIMTTVHASSSKNNSDSTVLEVREELLEGVLSSK